MCDFLYNGKQLNENELQDEYNKLVLTEKFSPIQLSNVLRKDYYNEVVEGKEPQPIIHDIARTKEIEVEEVADTKLMWYKGEEPIFDSLGKNIKEAKEAILRDITTRDSGEVTGYNDVKILGYNKDNYNAIIETTKSLPNLFEAVGLITTSNELKTIAKTINNSKLNRIISKLDLSSTVLEINNKAIKGMFYEDVSDILKDLGISNKNNIIVLEEGYDIETRLIHEGAHKHNDITGIPEQNFTQEKILALIDVLQKKAINETTVLDVKDYITQSIKKGRTAEIIPNLYQLFKESPIEAKKIFSKELLSLLENDGMFIYDGVSENIQSSNRYNYNELQIQKISKIPLNKGGLNNKYSINEEGEQTYLTKEGYVVVHIGYENYTAIIDKVDIEDTTNLPSISEFQQLIDYSNTVKTINRLNENENNYEYLAAEEKGYYQWKQDVEIDVKNYIDKYEKNNKFYQLESDTKPQLTNEEAVTKLKSFINTQGFEAKAIISFEKHIEVNGKTFTINGFVDLTNKIIKYDEQSLPEEAFTLARALFVKDDSTIYDQVRQHPLYQQVKIDYKGIYKTELEFAKETLDKLGAENIIRKANTVDGRLMARLKRIWNNLITWVKGNSELQSFLDEMSSNILSDSFVGEKNEDVTGVFYQIDSTKFKESTILNNFKKELEDVVRAKTARMKIYAAKAVKSFGKTEGRRIAELNKDLANDKITLGIVSFLNQTETEAILIQGKLKQLVEKYDKLTTKEKASLLNDMQAFLQAYEEPLLNIQSDINLFAIDEKYNEIKPTLDKTIELIRNLKTQYKRIGTVLFAETLYPFAQKNPEINNVEDLIKKLESSEDINFLRRMLNSMGNSTDDVLATVDQLVKQHKEKARLKSEDKIKDILILDKKLKDAGIKDTEWMFENDSRNFVSRYKEAEYKNNLDKEANRLRTKYAFSNNKYERESFVNVYNDFKIKAWLKENSDALKPIVDDVNKKNRGATQEKIRELIWEKAVKDYRTEWAIWHEDNSQSVDDIEQVVLDNLVKFYDSQVFESERRDDAINDIFDVLYLGKKGKVSLTSAENKAKELFEEWLSDRRRITKKGKFYYVYELSRPDDKYLNKQYDEIQSNPLKKEYYDFVIDQKEQSESFLPEKFVNRFQAPQIRKDLLARVQTGGVNKIKESVKDAFQIRESDTDFGQLVRDADGNIVQFVLTDEKNNPVNFLPVHFANPIDDIQDMSKDTTSIMASFIAMAEDYNEMNKIVDILELGNEILAQRKIEVGENLLSKTSELFTGQKAVSQQLGGLAYQRYVDYMKMVVYGQAKEKESNKFLEKFNIDQAKLVDAFNQYTGISGLALNLSSGINNVILGNAMTRQEAIAGEFFDNRDLLEADKIYTKEILGVMGDIGNNLSNSKLRLFEEKLDVFQDYSQRVMSLEADRSRFGKLINTSSLFFISKSGEYQIQLRTALAIANKTKVKVDGVEMSVWDALEVNNYKINIKPNTKKLNGSDFTEDDLIEMSLKIRGLGNKLNGIYSAIDRAAIQKWSLGRMALLFRKFVVPGFNRRFEDKRFDYDTNSQTEGYYRSAFRFFTKLGQELKAGQFDYLARWNELSDMEKANFWRTMVDVAYVMLALVAIGILSNLDGDDDDNWALNMASVQVNRLYTDLRFFSSPTEFLRLMKSPAVGINQLNTIVNFSKTIDPFGYVFGEDSFIREMKSGKNKGETYFWVNLKKAVPVVNQIDKTLHPDEQLIFYSK